MIHQLIFQAIADRLRLAPALTEKAVHIDWFRDQLRSPDNAHPFNRPAVLIEIVPGKTQPMLAGRSITRIQIRCHTVEDRFTDTNPKAAIRLYPLVDAVVARLSRFSKRDAGNSTMLFNTLVYVGTTSDHGSGNLELHTITFDTYVWQKTSVPATTLVTLTPNVTVTP